LGEVEDPARMPLKPGQHSRVLVGGIVIDNGVDDLAGWNLGLDGTVTGQNMQRHRHQEFIRFLNAIEDIEGGKQRGGGVGARPWLRQVRCTELAEIPEALAMADAVQCVTSPGGGPSVSSTTRATVPLQSGGLREGRVLSRKRPSTPSCI